MSERRILIVEDEVIVGLDLKLQLEEDGYACVGPARSVDEALNMIDMHAPLGFAVLDANLNGQSSAEVATRLADLEVPFVYVSGYGEEGILEQMPAAPLLSKPLLVNQLLDHISARIG